LGPRKGPSGLGPKNQEPLKGEFPNKGGAGVPAAIKGGPEKNKKP